MTRAIKAFFLFQKNIIHFPTFLIIKRSTETATKWNFEKMIRCGMQTKIYICKEAPQIEGADLPLPGTILQTENGKSKLRVATWKRARD